MGTVLEIGLLFTFAFQFLVLCLVAGTALNHKGQDGR